MRPRTLRSVPVLLLVTALLISSGAVPMFSPMIFQPQRALAQLAGGTALTATDDLNLRYGPGTDTAVVAIIPKGATVVARGWEDGNWIAVEYGTKTGWVARDYVSTAASGTGTAVTTDDVNLRTGPGLGTAVLTVIPSGTTVTRTGQSSNGYVSVSWQSYRGWVSADYLGGGSANGIATDDVNLRTGPGLGYGVLTIVPRGSRLGLTGQRSGGFVSVTFGGRSGWVSSDYVGPDAGGGGGGGTTVRTYGLTNDTVNFRSGPDTSRGVIRVLSFGAVLELTGNQSNGFRAARYNGVDGWVSATYVDVLPSVSMANQWGFDVDDSIVGAPRGSVDVALDFARRAGAKRMDNVEEYIREIYRLAPAVGMDPAILVAQSALETGQWKSDWWVQRLNPAGIGITGDPRQESGSPRYSNGIMAARAQIAHMHAEVFGSSRALPAVLRGVDPTYDAVFHAGWAGKNDTIRKLAGTWATDPQYHVKIVRKANEIFG